MSDGGKAFEDYIVHRVNDIVLHPKKNWRAYKRAKQSMQAIGESTQEYFQPRRKRVRQEGHPYSTTIKKPRFGYKMPYRRRTYGRRRRTFRRGGYRKYRRRATWPRRVRSAAIKLHESKRHKVFVADGSLGELATNDSKVFNLCEVEVVGAAETGLTAKNKRIGTTIWPKGLAMRFFIRNLSATDETYVRIIVGYAKYDRQVTTRDRIFKDRETEDRVPLTSMTTNFMRCYASINKKNFVTLMDRRVHLMGLDAVESGNATQSFKAWIPLKRYMKFDDADVLDDEVGVNYMPYVLMYAYDRNMQTTGVATDVARVTFESIFYFKDP